uniref:Toxoplasma gondii family D protein n=1 Tax=Neospora caninum (strain Liverpool) TaxID=572307 RepID=A0A0F7U8W4_NEOCL|nr:TPA: hypothetical protein BN1204_009050 [Neospora caninum Liverpool]
MRWIEKPCNLVNYELKCSKRLVELPGKCTKEWMVQQPYPCALTSTVEECTVQDIQVSDQCTKSVVKPVSFDCVKETLETYCEGQLEFITLPQTAVRPPPKDQESWKKNKLPLKVLRKLVEVNQGEQDSGPLEDSFGSVGGHSLCHRKAQRHVPYTCSRPRMKQKCNVIKQTRKHRCIKVMLGRTRKTIGYETVQSDRSGTLLSDGESMPPTGGDGGSLVAAAAGNRNNSLRRLGAVYGPAVPLHSLRHCIDVPVRVQKTCKDVSLKNTQGECETEADEEVCETVKDAEPDTCYMEFTETYVCRSESEKRQLVPSNCKTRSVKRKEMCMKTLPFTEDFACQTKVPVTTCSPVEKTDATTCYRAARKAMEYSCVKPTEVEECVPVPAYIAGKCFEQEEYKEAYECTETQVRQKCEDLEKEVASRCDKVIKQKVSYPCKKTAVKRACPGREQAKGVSEIPAPHLAVPLSSKESSSVHSSVHNSHVNESERTKHRTGDSTMSPLDPVTQQAALAALSLAHTVAGIPSSTPELPNRPSIAALSSHSAKDRLGDRSRYDEVGTRARRLLPAFKPWGLKSKKEPAPYSSSTVQLPVPPPPVGGVYLGPRAHGINEFNRHAALDSADIPSSVGSDSRLPPSHVVELNDIGNQHRKYYNTDPSRVLPPVPPSPLPPVAFHSLAPSEDHHAHDVVLIEHQRDRSEARSPVSDDGSPAPLAPLAPGSPVPSLLFDVPSPSLAVKSGVPAAVGASHFERGEGLAVEEPHGHNQQPYSHPAPHGHKGNSRLDIYPVPQHTSSHVQIGGNSGAPELHHGDFVGESHHLVDTSNVSAGYATLEENRAELQKEYSAAAAAAHYCHIRGCVGHPDKTFHQAPIPVAVLPFSAEGVLSDGSGGLVLPLHHDAVLGPVMSDSTVGLGGIPKFGTTPSLHRIQQLLTEIHYLMQFQQTQGGHLTDQQHQRLEEIISELESFTGSSSFPWRHSDHQPHLAGPNTSAFPSPGVTVVQQPSGENNDNGSKYSQSGHNRNSQGLSGDGAAAPHSDFQPEKLRELLESLLSELRIEEKNLTRTMNNTDADNGPVDDLAQELELIRDDIGVVEDGLSRLERKDLSNTEMQSLWQFLLGDNASSMEGVSPDSDASEADDVYGTKKDAEPTLDSATIEPNPHYMNSAHDHMPMNATQPVFPEDRVGSVALAAAAAALHKAMEISFASPNTSGHHQLQLKKMSPHVAASPREALMAAILQGAFEIKARILRSMQAIQQLLETADMPTDREKEAEDLLEGLKRDMEKMHQIVDRVKAGELSLSDLQYIAIQLEAIRQEVKTSDVAQAESSSQYPSNLRPTSERANFPSAGMLRSQLEQGNLDGQLDPGSVTDLPFAGKGIPSSQGTGAVAFESDRAEPSSEKENRNFLTPPARTNVYITINIDESGSVTSGR